MRLLAAVAVGAAASSLIVLTSDPYPGVTVDSAEYLAVARSLTEGDGLTMPYISYDEAFRVLQPGERVTMTQFPPLYPAVLALVQTATGSSFFDAVRITGAMAFGALAALVTVIVARQTGGLLLGAAAAALLLAPDLLTLHAMAWSEVIMLAALVAALHFAALHFREGSTAALWLSGAFGMVASMARFAGVAVLVAIALALIQRPGPSMKRRFPSTAAFLVVTMIPTVAWFVRNMAVAGYASEKKLGWHPPGLDHLAQAVQAVGSWVVPGKAAAFATGAVLLVATLVTLWVKRPPLPSIATLPGLSLAFAGVYLLFMLATKTLLDQNISLDGRILAPLHVSLLIGLCSLIPKRGLPAQVIGVIVILLAVTVARSVHAAVTFSSSGTASYTNERWLSSPALAFTGSLPEQALIVSNAPDPIWLWHNRQAQILPPVVNLYTGQPNVEHDEQVTELKRAAACRDTFVVFFEQPTRKPPREIPGTLVAELDLQLERAFSDGDVYAMGDLPPC